MEYPRTPEHLDRRKKLTQEDVLKIKKLSLSGISTRSIATILNVSQTLIRYHLGAKKEMNQRRVKDMNFRITSDPDYKQAQRKRVARSNAHKRKLMAEEYKQYRLAAYKERVEKHPDYSKQKNKKFKEKNPDYGKTYYHKNKEKIKEYRKEYKKRNKIKLEEYFKKYREENSEKIKAYATWYKEKFPEKLKASKKKYKDKIKELKQKI